MNLEEITQKAFNYVKENHANEGREIQEKVCRAFLQGYLENLKLETESLRSKGSNYMKSHGV